MALPTLNAGVRTTLAYALALYVFYLVASKVTLYFAQRRFMRRNGCYPCYSHVPVVDKLFGLDELYRLLQHSKSHTVLQYNLDCYAKLGNTYQKLLLGQNWLFLNDPENIKTVQSLKFEDYSTEHRRKPFIPLLGHGIFNADGKLWAHSRAMLKPSFARENVAELDTLERVMQDFFARIPANGETVDLQELFFELTMDTATHFLFNQSTHMLRRQPEDTDLDNQFPEAFTRSLQGCINRYRMRKLARFFKSCNTDDWDAKCHAYTEKYVTEALRIRDEQEKTGSLEKGNTGRYIFIQELAKVHADKDRLRDELLNILLAGRDTTAGLLSNLFFILARRPDIYAKIRQEVTQKLENRLPTYDDLKSLKYLRACINESLRLHPPVPSNARAVAKDTVLPLGGGPDGRSPLFVPKGYFVSWQVYTLHRRKDYYGEDAEEFVPERWEKLRPGWEYLPFSGGPRTCLGQQYALTEAGYVLARFVQKYEKLEQRDPRQEWVEDLHLTVRTLGGVKVGCRE